jgi:hypothetical protein
MILSVLQFVENIAEWECEPLGGKLTASYLTRTYDMVFLEEFDGISEQVE